MFDLGKDRNSRHMNWLCAILSNMHYRIKHVLVNKHIEACSFGRRYDVYFRKRTMAMALGDFPLIKDFF